MSEGTMRDRRPARLADEWPDSKGERTVRQLIRKASGDTDPVLIFSFAGERREDADAAVVVLKGRDVVRCFREWAKRNGVLTPGKGVER
jgi:hypothetical protein